jgi:hypothetical protein
MGLWAYIHALLCICRDEEFQHLEMEVKEVGAFSQGRSRHLQCLTLRNVSEDHISTKERSAGSEGE